MSGPCSSYATAGEEVSGPCRHPAGYLAWDDDLQTEIDYCACHYGEPYDAGECAPSRVDEAAERLGLTLLPWQRDLAIAALQGKRVTFVASKRGGKSMLARVLEGLGYKAI